MTWPELTAAVFGVPRRRLALAVALTVLNDTVLTGVDQVACAYRRFAFAARVRTREVRRTIRETKDDKSADCDIAPC